MSARAIIGLDIGTSTIKAVVLSHRETPPKLLSLGYIPSPTPGIISESELDLEAVAGAIKNLVSELDPPTHDAVIALPESKIFTRVIYDQPYFSNEELAQAIKYIAEEFVPMPIQDVTLNYQVIFRSPAPGPKSKTVVFVVASPKNLIEKYLKVLAMAQLNPIAIETALIAAARSLVSFNQFSPTTLVIQMGATTTDLAVVSDGLILVTRSIATGGSTLTRAIGQAFNFEPVQSEEYKKIYGLVEDQLEGKLFQALKPIVDVILSEAKRIIQSHENQHPARTVKRIVLAGGGAQLPGLVIYFANNLGLEVQEADPWLSITKDPNFKSKLATGGALYSVATGLALREV